MLPVKLGPQPVAADFPCVPHAAVHSRGWIIVGARPQLHATATFLGASTPIGVAVWG
eukprot:COSAG02_NODE_242_length_27511_cov_501.886364_14_plen_57_part_00